MTILRLSKRALSIILLAALGFAIAFSLPMVSQEIMTPSSNHASLSQPINWQQASEHPESYSLIENLLKQSPLTHPIEPTPEMVTFFERRTREHIDRVRRNLAALAVLPDYPQEILDRGEIHDESKFVPPERIPYIWLTEFHRRRQNGETIGQLEKDEEIIKVLQGEKGKYEARTKTQSLMIWFLVFLVVMLLMYIFLNKYGVLQSVKNDISIFRKTTNIRDITPQTDQSIGELEQSRDSGTKALPSDSDK